MRTILVDNAKELLIALVLTGVLVGCNSGETTTVSTPEQGSFKKQEQLPAKNWLRKLHGMRAVLKKLILKY